MVFNSSKSATSQHIAQKSYDIIQSVQQKKKDVTK